MTDKTESQISDVDKERIELLADALESESAGILLCKDKITGEDEPLIVIFRETDTRYEFYPVARLFRDIDAVFDRYVPLLDCHVDEQEETDGNG